MTPIADRQVLDAPVAVMNQAVSVGTRPESLLERVERQVGGQGVGDPPTDDLPGEHVDNEGDVDEADPSGAIAEIRDPELIRTCGREVAVDSLRRPQRRLLVGILAKLGSGRS